MLKSIWQNLVSLLNWLDVHLMIRVVSSLV